MHKLKDKGQNKEKQHLMDVPGECEYEGAKCTFISQSVSPWHTIAQASNRTWRKKRQKSMIASKIWWAMENCRDRHREWDAVKKNFIPYLHSHCTFSYEYMQLLNSLLISGHTNMLYPIYLKNYFLKIILISQSNIDKSLSLKR